jgi:hypothetical protein
MASVSIPLDILFYRVDDCWVGYCIQLDLITASKEFEAVQQDVFNICVAQVEFAFKNDLLEHLFRPPDQMLTGMMLKALQSGDLVQMKVTARQVDNKELSFRPVAPAAYARAA